MTNHPADGPRASWRCKARSAVLTLGDLTVPSEVCSLPTGHGGSHRADSGNHWDDLEVT